MRKLYKFHIDGGEFGRRNSFFIMEDEFIKELFGKPVLVQNWDKYKQLWSTFDEECVTCITDDQSFINTALKHGMARVDNVVYPIVNETMHHTSYIVFYL